MSRGVSPGRVVDLSGEPNVVQPEARPPRDRQEALRVRAAWLYHIEGMTQSEVAEHLDVSRIAVTRLLADARARREVVVRVTSDIAVLVQMQADLEGVLGLDRAIVVPMSSRRLDPTRSIAAAAGAYVSELMTDGMTIGVGWGRTLQTMLQYVEARPLEDVRVISLLGGIAKARRFNPAEFAWQFAELFAAEGYLIPAPAIVDSVQTRRALLENCGLDEIFQMAETCDAVLLSCGGIDALTTSYRVGYVSERERRSLAESGAIGDVLYNFLDRDGRIVPHPVNARAVAMPLERLARVRNRVLISGGPEKVEVIDAIVRSLQPHTLVTDEVTALALLKRRDQPSAQGRERHAAD